MGLFDSISNIAGDLTGGIIGESSAEAAVSGLQRISRENRDEILTDIGDTETGIESLFAPYIEAGRTAIQGYNTAMGNAPDAPVFEGFQFDPSKMEQNPAYQFIKQQGQQAMDRMAAKNQALTSGNRMTAMADYMSGLASTEYGNEFNRQLQMYGTNETAKGRNFDVRNMLNRQQVSDFGNLMTMGANMTGNLSNVRSNMLGARSGARSNYAAEQTSAQLIPVQERQNYVQGLMAMIGGSSGAMAGGA